MKTNSTFLSSAFVAVLLFAASTQSYALNYTIGFTASIDTTAVGSVQVQNITKGTSVTVPEGSVLNLNVISTAVDEVSADNSGIRIAQQAATGKSTLTFYAKQAGKAVVEAYGVDGKKIVGQSFKLEQGDNSIEMLLGAGRYVVRVLGNGYAYSTKLQSQTTSALQAELKLMGSSKNLAFAPQKSKSVAMTLVPTVTMDYSTGDQLKYTATVGSTTKFKAVVKDVPVASKTIDFKYIACSDIPAGTFLMGSPSREFQRVAEEVQHSVTLSAFRMSKKEITNQQFADFANAVGIDEFGIWDAAPFFKGNILVAESTTPAVIPSDFGMHYVNSKWVPVAGYENYPSLFISWYGAFLYANYVGAKLATEAQWEYACRAGTTTPFNTGDFITNLQATYDWRSPYNGGTNSSGTTFLGKCTPVGSYAPNAWGLYDMHGNGIEFVNDWYGPYPTDAVTDPTGPATGTSVIVRGGSLRRVAGQIRSAYRSTCTRDYLSMGCAIRLVFEP